MIIDNEVENVDDAYATILNTRGDYVLNNVNKEDSTSLVITSNPLNLENDNNKLNNISTNPVIQQQINSHYNYLIKEYGTENKEALYEYAKQMVLNNPLLKNKINLNSTSNPISNNFNTNNSLTFNSLNNNSSKIVICKEDKNFNSKKAFGEEEDKKDAFDFVNDMLKTKK